MIGRVRCGGLVFLDENRKEDGAPGLERTEHLRDPGKRFTRSGQKAEGVERSSGLGETKQKAVAENG